MALWTPYAEDAALDLSVKCSRDALPDYGYHYSYVYPNMLPTDPSLHPGYTRYARPTYVPLAETSPSSSCSGCPPQLSPPLRTGMISPPDSPPSLREQGSVGAGHPPDVDALSDDPDFQAFERDALRAMAEKNGGTLLGNNPRMRRAVQTSHAADDSYRKQRERNNFAAKQSRDRRKLREIHLALKVTYLKSEMAKLKAELAASTCARCLQGRACGPGLTPL